MTISRRLYRLLSASKAQIVRTPLGRSRPVRHLSAALRRRLVSDDIGSLSLRVADVQLRLPTRFIPHYVRSDYEPLTCAWLKKQLQPGMNVVDVGAHIGFFTVFMANLVGETGHVHAFEPAEENLEYLRYNVRANGRGSMTTVTSAAVGPATGTRLFHLVESSDSHGFYAHPVASTARTVRVRQVCLDDEVAGDVDLVKIDVEGAELEVLEGMQQVLANNPGIRLCVEWNPSCLVSAGRDPALLPTRLQELGFDLVALDDRTGRSLDLPETIRRVACGQFEPWWYVNLVGVRHETRP